jgi:hypothetical protein
MVQLLLHLWGDYIFQNDWMATNKVKNNLIGYLSCLIHCVLYSLPFLLICNVSQIGIIFITHFVIDKYRLAKYLCRLKNIHFKGNGFPDSTPIWLSTWVTIIVDNVLHVTINYLVLTNILINL